MKRPVYPEISSWNWWPGGYGPTPSWLLEKATPVVEAQQQPVENKA
jgi:hypothetical protein